MTNETTKNLDSIANTMTTYIAISSEYEQFKITLPPSIKQPENF